MCSANKTASVDNEATEAPPEDALEMLARVRQERADRLAAAVHVAPVASDHDLEMNLRMVRGLLATNEEILGRCTGRSVKALETIPDVLPEGWEKSISISSGGS